MGLRWSSRRLGLYRQCLPTLFFTGAPAPSQPPIWFSTSFPHSTDRRTPQPYPSFPTSLHILDPSFRPFAPTDDDPPSIHPPDHLFPLFPLGLFRLQQQDRRVRRQRWGGDGERHPRNLGILGRRVRVRREDE